MTLGPRTYLALLLGPAVVEVVVAHRLGGGAALLALPVVLWLLRGTLAALERVAPLGPHEGRYDHADSDVLYLLTRSEALWVTAAGAVAALSPLDVWPHGLPLPLQVALGWVLADGCWCLWHYAHHRSELLWRMHAPHHSPARLWAGNGDRKHPLSPLSWAAVVASLGALGMPLDVAPAVVAMGSSGLILHADIAWNLGRLRAVLVTPDRHRWHHAADGGLRWMGTGLVLWDVLLGTARDEWREPDALGTGEPSYPMTWAGQTLAPLTYRAPARVEQP